MAKGIVYVCSTVIPGLIKIGKTRTDRYEDRMRELEDNGYKNCTGLKREFAIEVDDYDAKEVIVHTAFEAHQVGNTELYACNLDKVINILISFDGRIVYPIGESKEEIKEKADEGVASSELPDGEYTFVSIQKKYKGTLNVHNGILTLLAGSSLAEMSEDASPNWVATRKAFGTAACILPKDLNCSSVSEAGYYVCGHRQNGWKAWKDSKGNYIDIYRKKASQD